MTQPADLQFTVPIDSERLERLHRFAQTAARRLPPPSDPLLAEFVKGVAEGRNRPREFLLSPHYQPALEPMLRRAAERYQELDQEERTEQLAEGESMISELLGQEDDDRKR